MVRFVEFVVRFDQEASTDFRRVQINPEHVACIDSIGGHARLWMADGSKLTTEVPAPEALHRLNQS